MAELDLTILMPCLNEAETLAVCIGKAQRFLDTSGISGEIVVADNGSTDGSQDLARLNGARVVDSRGGLPDDEFRVLYKALLAYYAENNCVHTRPYPGVNEALDGLAEHGVRLALITNKFESFARDILGKLDLARRFEIILGGDTLGKGRSKPAPDPLIEARARLGGGRFAYIGDSSYDVLSARAAQVPVVVAGYGYCDKAPAELGGDAVIRSLDELIPALESI